jgi:tetratricopeptide (TPR) repeat protein
MKIPKRFYFHFWLKNSVMATATGFVLGIILMMLIPFLFPLLTVPIVTLIIYQFLVQKYFWGCRRGHFEYAYREWLHRKALNSLVKKALGFKNFIRLYMDELSAFGSVREDIYMRLQREGEITKDNNNKFLLYVRIAESALKEFNFAREQEFFKKALSIRPNNLVVNYRLGNSLEKIGDSAGAIRSYETALTDQTACGKELKELVLEQIKRVEESGPAKKPPVFGFSYMSW